MTGDGFFRVDGTADPVTGAGYPFESGDVINLDGQDMGNFVAVGTGLTAFVTYWG